jgi:nicotinamidase-related amidase
MITTNNTVLVVVDIQGKLAEIAWRSADLLRNARILIEGMHILDIPILATEQYPAGIGHTVPVIQEALKDAPVLEKGTFSCCGSLQFESKLSELHRPDVLLCGIETHVCVYQTAVDLLGLGYNVHLVTDAVSSRTEENRALGIRAIERLGARPTSVEMALFELLVKSGTEQFKAISKLVK